MARLMTSGGEKLPSAVKSVGSPCSFLAFNSSNRLFTCTETAVWTIFILLKNAYCSTMKWSSTVWAQTWHLMHLSMWETVDGMTSNIPPMSQKRQCLNTAAVRYLTDCMQVMAIRLWTLTSFVVDRSTRIDMPKARLWYLPLMWSR